MYHVESKHETVSKLNLEDDGATLDPRIILDKPKIRRMSDPRTSSVGNLTTTRVFGLLYWIKTRSKIS